MISFDNDWDALLADEFKKPYYLALRQFLKHEYQTKTVYPPMHDIYNALKHTSYADTKVLILGQDPYINRGQAHGLSFSVNKGVAIPPSLHNIFLELGQDLGLPYPAHGCLVSWAKQGVLLLNAALTVEGGLSRSHANKGWEILTDSIIMRLNQKQSPVAFMLWGRDAQKKRALVSNPLHKILTAAHPSPMSCHRGFFGCRHFSIANEFLKNHGLAPIDWGAI